MSGNFVHLHNHSDYSLLDGAISIAKMVNAAAEDGMPALALTDHGNMFGAVTFYAEARKRGIKPIIGMEAYSVRGDRKARDRKVRTDHLILLCRDLEGYHNLLKLSTLAFQEGFYYKPRVDRELLRRHCGGLIATSACMSGEVNRFLIADQYEDAQAAALELQEIFGEGNFFLEIQNHGIAEEEIVRRGAIRLSKETGIPLVATNDCHYLAKGDHNAHEALLCINTGKDLEDETRFHIGSKELYFKTCEEMNELFADTPEAVANTLRIAERCDLEIPLGKHLLPHFPLPQGYEGPDDYLAKLAAAGLKDRYDEVDAHLSDRLNFELGVIREMGFSGYFLIVRDFIVAARERGIAVGPGRGSAAGSLVCYALGITDIDPMGNGLLFERFLNPERISMPDIDIDFDYERRGEVIDYVTEKYGSDHVCQIITFGTMKARAVVRDVGRVLGLPYGDVDRIAKLVPDVLGMTLDKALEQSPDLAALRKESEIYEKLISYSLTLEGLTRHASTHAAGVLITPDALFEHVPLYVSNKGEVTTQYDMVTCEQIGLLKMDFLGLRTLTVIEKALAAVNEDPSRQQAMAADDIPLDDEKTYDLLRAADTVGVFQLESGGMRDLLSRLQPGRFEEIVAVVALFRPGPLGSGMVDDFIDRKHGRKSIRYPHEDLEDILKETYGTIVYQEQVMQIAAIIAGFSMGQADVLRKAMGKKNMVLLGEIRNSFVSGAEERGHSERFAQDLWEQVEYFGGYGFNKSHSAAYAVLSIQTAYLKAHYPAEYLAACMTSEMSTTSRIVVFMNECRVHGIEVVPPDLSVSHRDFRVVDGRVFFGLGAVKNVGEGAIDEIVRAREETGGFRDLFHLCESINLKKVNRKVLESLIAAGAMDCLGANRPSLLAALEGAIRGGQSRQADKHAGQLSLLDALGEEERDQIDGKVPELDDWSGEDKLTREKEVLGFYVSGHPLDRFRDSILALPVINTESLAESGDQTAVRAVGIINAVNLKVDSKGRSMAFLTVEDFLGSYEVLVFSSAYERFRSLLLEDKVVAMIARVSAREEEKPKLLLEEACSLEDALTKWPREVHLHLRSGYRIEWLEDLSRKLGEHPGTRPVYFHLRGEKGESVIIKARDLKIEAGSWLMGFLRENSEKITCRLKAPSVNIPNGGRRRQGMVGNSR